MEIAIIDYGAGNIQSVKFALERLGVNTVLTDDADKLRKADKVILPGVGEAKYAMDMLQERNLTQVIKSLKQPVLGICLGLQLLCQHSDERDTACLGMFPVAIKEFPATNKIPHMGWNQLHGIKGKLFQGIAEQSYVYFVHSYYAEQSPYASTLCTYDLSFSASLEKDNFYACQFHPEKSGESGLQILKNFVELC